MVTKAKAPVSGPGISEDEGAAVEGVTGRYFADCRETRPSSRATDTELAKRLWTISEELLGIERT